MSLLQKANRLPRVLQYKLRTVQTKEEQGGILMKPLFQSHRIAHTIALLLVLLIAIASLGVIDMKSQLAKATNNTPLQLESIGTISPTGNYHRGGQIELWANYYDTTGQSLVFTAHPAVYHNTYKLINVTTNYTSRALVGMQQVSWWITIPKNAPLGTYKYWLTLMVSGYPNQTLMISFNMAKGNMLPNTPTPTNVPAPTPTP